MPLKNSEVVPTWFERVWNKGQEAAIDELLAESAVIHGLVLPPGSAKTGPASFKPFWRQFRASFPDIRIVMLDCVTEGTNSVGHCRVTGTHTGEAFMTLSATHKKMDFTGMALARVEGGKIQEGWNSFDFLGMYRQLGALHLLQ
jgi:predicted ester cyclase